MKTTKQQAKADGYRPLTRAYSLPQEEWMLNNVVADMRRANIEFVLVAEPTLETEVEVWKK